LKIVGGYFKGQRPYVIAFLGAFHGHTYGAMSLTASKPVQRRHFSPLVPEVIHMPFPHPVHCPFKASTQEECGEYALAFLEDWVFKRLVDPTEVSLVIVQPIQGIRSPAEELYTGVEKAHGGAWHLIRRG